MFFNCTLLCGYYVYFSLLCIEIYNIYIYILHIYIYIYIYYIYTYIIQIENIGDASLCIRTGKQTIKNDETGRIWEITRKKLKFF